MKLLFSSFFLFIAFFANAQVGIGTANPAATLDITATPSTGTTVEGILIPRITRQRAKDMLTSPPTSTLIYITTLDGTLSPTIANITSVGFYFFNGTVWEKLASGTPNAWIPTGNSGLSGTTNFLGTTDAVDVAFRRNNAAAGKIGATSTAFGVGALNAGVASNSSAFGTNALVLNTGNDNVAFGNGVLSANTTGTQNTGVGNAALAVNTGSASTAIGNRALAANTTGANGTAVGFEALARNTTASNNTGIGFQALAFNTTGTQNTALGFQSSFAMATGNRNTAIGYTALAGNTAGNENTAIGNNALGRNTGSGNTAIGHESMFGSGAAFNNSTAVGWHALFGNSANNNTAVGFNALQGNQNASGNTAVGSEALNNNATGTNNTALGTQAGFAAMSSNNTFIGFTAGQFSGGANNTAVGSNTLKANAASANNVAIGYNALTVNGSTNNTAVGYGSLSTNNSSGNVAIGYNSGALETGSNKLYIENSNADANGALIYGEFDTNIVRVNGTLQISNPTVAGYSLPIVRGTNGQVLQTNGAGTTSWVNASTLAVTETDPQVSSTTTTFIPRWNGTTLVDGVIRDDGTNVGIGVAPTTGNKLDVAGKIKTINFQMTNGANSGYFLQSDVNGNANWAPIPVNTVKPFTTTDVATGVYNVSLNEYTVRVYNGVSEVRLPSAVGNAGRIYIIIGSNGITAKTFSTAGGGIYDDVSNATVTVLNANERYMVQSDGTGWIVIGR